jgi:hypothetical protein
MHDWHSSGNSGLCSDADNAASCAVAVIYTISEFRCVSCSLCVYCALSGVQHAHNSRQMNEHDELQQTPD